MKNAQEKVRNWMVKFGQEVPSSPVIPSLEVRELRAKLMLEECLETIEAMGLMVVANNYDQCSSVDLSANSTGFTFLEHGEPNLIAIQDGCSDLHVVTLGTEVACGLTAEPAFDEVMRSNDSKLWWAYEVVIFLQFDKSEDHQIIHGKIGDTVSRNGYTATMKDHAQGWLVKNSSGKVLKSPSYSKAELAQFCQQK